MTHLFGGNWTKEKLNILDKYLSAYTIALKRQNFYKIYVDAFAGTGYVNIFEGDGSPLLPEFSEDDVRDFTEGSAQLALGVQPPFDEYYFIEKSVERFGELSKLRIDFPTLAGRINTLQGDANQILMNLVQRDWRFTRAVVFLDPYGMQVRWKTLEAIARTQAIDLWILFPLGVAVNRLLKRDGEISKGARTRLDELFGTNEWYSEFYKPKSNPGLFDLEPAVEKTANWDSIGEYFNKRLATIFADVAPRPRRLVNSTNNPLYLLCFAVGNPSERAKRLAIKIANDILTKF